MQGLGTGVLPGDRRRTLHKFETTVLTSSEAVNAIPARTIFFPTLCEGRCVPFIIACDSVAASLSFKLGCGSCEEPRLRLGLGEGAGGRCRCRVMGKSTWGICLRKREQSQKGFLLDCLCMSCVPQFPVSIHFCGNSQAAHWSLQGNCSWCASRIHV